MANCVALILAGGRGERLGSLTDFTSKPAIHFGGDRRIIDFTLKNCVESGISRIGVVTQYNSSELHKHISSAYRNRDVHLLPSSLTGTFYEGTADAVYKNIRFIDRFDPDHVLILAGDHIYNMDYQKMIDSHVEAGADVTIATHRTSMKNASRFGILTTGSGGRVVDFEEKPAKPKSDMASMGVYVFKWPALREILTGDRLDLESGHDFGGDIIPGMLRSGYSLNAYEYQGYWRDVGTVESLWEASMELLDLKSMRCRWQIEDFHFGGIGKNNPFGPSVRQSVVPADCAVSGKVERSVFGNNVVVSKGAKIVNSVIMPDVYIGSNVRIQNAIVGAGAEILDNTIIGVRDGSRFFSDKKLCTGSVSLVEPGVQIPKAMKFRSSAHITDKKLQEWAEATWRALEARPGIGWILPDLAITKDQEPIHA